MVALPSGVETPYFSQALFLTFPFICTILSSLQKLPSHCFIDSNTSRGSLGGQGFTKVAFLRPVAETGQNPLPHSGAYFSSSLWGVFWELISPPQVGIGGKGHDTLLFPHFSPNTGGR